MKKILNKIRNVIEYKEDFLAQPFYKILAQKLEAFLKNPDKKVLLVSGEAFCGKSRCCQWVAQQYMRNDDITPLYIDLSRIKNPLHNLVEQQLQIIGLLDSEISLSKKTPFLFIIDNCDIRTLFYNLYVVNRLADWPNSKTLVMTRSIYFIPQENDRIYYMPFRHAHACPDGMDEIKLAAITQEEIDQMLLTDKVAEHLDRHPRLQALVFSHRFFLHAYHQHFIKGKQLSEKQWLQTLMKNWFEQQAKVLLRRIKYGTLMASTKHLSKDILQKICWQMTIRLAQKIQQQPKHEFSYNAPSWFCEQRNNLESWEDFFKLSNNPLAILTLASYPLRRQQDGSYSFLTESLLEYLAEQTCDEIFLITMKAQFNNDTDKTAENALISQALPSSIEDTFNRALFVDQIDQVQLMAESIIRSTSSSESIKDRLFDLVNASRDRPVEIAAANAVTILNLSGECFSGIDFSYIRIAGANLSEAICDETNFSCADLSGVNFRAAWLRKAQFNGAELQDIQFSESPFLAHQGKLSAIAFSPDGNLIATCVGGDKNVYLWDWRNNKCLHALAGKITRDCRNKESTCKLQFSNNGKLLAVSGASRFLSLWNLDSADMSLIELESNYHNGDFVFSSDDDFLAIASDGVQIWHPDTGKKIYSYKEAHEQSKFVCFSANNQYLAVADTVGKIRLFERKKHQLKFEYKHRIKCSGGLKKIKFSPSDNTLLATLVRNDNCISLWNVVTGQLIQTLKHEGKVKGIIGFYFNNARNQINTISKPSAGVGIIFHCWDNLEGKLIFSFDMGYGNILNFQSSPDNSLLVTVEQGGSVKLWELKATGIVLIKDIHGHKKSVWHAQFSPDGKTLATGSWDKTVRLRDIGLLMRENIRSKKITCGTICVQRSPNRDIVASGDYRGGLKLWDAITGRRLRELVGHRSLITNIAFSSNGELLLTSECGVGNVVGATVCLWQVSTGRCLHTIKYSTSQYVTFFGGLYFSADDRIMVVLNIVGVIQFWDVDTGQLLFTREDKNIEKAGSCGALYSQKGRDNMLIAMVGIDKSVYVWDSQYENPLCVFTGHENSVSNLDFSPDGYLLASASFDGTVRLWDITADKLICILQGHLDYVYQVKFSPNGTVLASASADNTIRLWDVSSGKLISVLRGHQSCIYSLQFSPDGLFLASGSEDRTVRIWEVVLGFEIEVFSGYRGKVMGLSFASNDCLITGSEDGSVKYWKRNQTNAKNSWQLQWNGTATNVLCCDRIQLEGVKHLSNQNKILIRQHDAEQTKLIKAQSDIDNNLIDGKQLVQIYLQGVRCYLIENYKRALDYFKQALSAANQLHDVCYTLLSAINNSIAIVRYADHQPLFKVIMSCKKSVKFDQQLYSKAELVCARHLTNLGWLYKKYSIQEKSEYIADKAKKVFNRALIIYRGYYLDDKHPSVQAAKKNLLDCKSTSYTDANVRLSKLTHDNLIMDLLECGVRVGNHQLSNNIILLRVTHLSLQQVMNMFKRSHEYKFPNPYVALCRAAEGFGSVEAVKLLIKIFENINIKDDFTGYKYRSEPCWCSEFKSNYKRLLLKCCDRVDADHAQLEKKQEIKKLGVQAKGMVASPINDASVAHSSLMKEINVVIANNSKYSLFINSLKNRNYNQALRRIATAKRGNKTALKLAQILLKYKNRLLLNVNDQAGDKRYTALHYAALKGNIIMYQLLLQNGANEDLPSALPDRKTAKDFLQERGLLSKGFLLSE